MTAVLCIPRLVGCRLGLSLALGTLVLFGPAVSARGQNLRDEVQDHVEESLEKEKAKKKKKKSEKKKKKGSKSREKPGASKSPRSVEPKENDSPPKAPRGEKTKLPRRIFHKYFKLDLGAGAGYRGWIPQQYKAVRVNMAHFFTWSVSASARLFNFLSLKQGYYESSGVSSPRKSALEEATKYGSYAIKTAWFLAELGVPILDAWEPSLRYEARSFSTGADTRDGSEVCIVPFGQDADLDGCPFRSSTLNVISSYETAALGVWYHPSKNPSAVIPNRRGEAPPFYFGLAYLSYIKPYQVTIGTSVLDEYLFTGRFYGGGLALGTKLGGGVNRPYLNIWTQFGLGAIRLTHDLTLNELAPEDWLIGYIQGNAKFSYRWAPFDFAPSILFVPSGRISGAGFFFFETQVDPGEEIATSTVNWDLIYAVDLSLVITL